MINKQPAIAALLGILTLSIGLSYLVELFRRKRRESFREYAEQKKFHYREQADISDVPLPRGLRIFEGGEPYSITNFLEGKSGQWNVRIFDYFYKTISGKQERRRWRKSNFHQLTVVLIDHGGPSVPALSIHPEGLWDKIAAAAGFQDIDIPEYQKFSEQYRLRSGSPDAAAALISPQVAAWFEQQRRPRIDVCSQYLALCSADHEKVLSVKKTAALHETAIEFCNLLAAEQISRGLSAN